MRSSFKLLQTEWASVSIRDPALAPAGGCVEKQYMSSHPLRAARTRSGAPLLHPRGLKTCLANEEIVSKGLALNLGGLCGGCHLLPPSHSPGTWPARRERQQNPRAWEQMCEPAEPAPGCRSGCEPFLSHFCPSHPII